MNKISKYGLGIELITFIIMLVLVLFSQQVPELLMCFFRIGLIVTIAGAIVKQRKAFQSRHSGNTTLS
jgi:hypothetical protein